jgi:hypothetical protein
LGRETRYIEKLRTGETVSIRPRGASMKGRIESGQRCTVMPVDCSTLSRSEISSSAGYGMLNISGDRFQIGNHRGGINGWIGVTGIFGKCIRIEP